MLHLFGHRQGVELANPAACKTLRNSLNREWLRKGLVAVCSLLLLRTQSETPCLLATPLLSNGGYNLPLTCGVHVPSPGRSIARRARHALPCPEGAATGQPRAERSAALGELIELDAVPLEQCPRPAGQNQFPSYWAPSDFGRGVRQDELGSSQGFFDSSFTFLSYVAQQVVRETASLSSQCVDTKGTQVVPAIDLVHSPLLSFGQSRTESIGKVFTANLLVSPPALDGWRTEPPQSLRASTQYISNSRMDATEREQPKQRADSVAQLAETVTRSISATAERRQIQQRFRAVVHTGARCSKLDRTTSMRLRSGVDLESACAPTAAQP